MIKNKILTILGLFSLMITCNHVMADDIKSLYNENDWLKAKNICDSHVTMLTMENDSETLPTSITIQFNAGDTIGKQCITVYSHFIYEAQTDKLNQTKFLNDITNQKGKN